MLQEIIEFFLGSYEIKNNVYLKGSRPSPLAWAIQRASTDSSWIERLRSTDQLYRYYDHGKGVLYQK